MSVDVSPMELFRRQETLSIIEAQELDAASSGEDGESAILCLWLLVRRHNKNMRQGPPQVPVVVHRERELGHLVAQVSAC